MSKIKYKPYALSIIGGLYLFSSMEKMP